MKKFLLFVLIFLQFLSCSYKGKDEIPVNKIIKANFVKDKLKHDFPNIGMSGVFVEENYEYEEVIVHKGLLGTIGGGIKSVGGGFMNAGGAVKNVFI